MKGFKKLLAVMLFGVLALAFAACNSLVNVDPNGENVGSFRSYDDLKAYLEEFYEGNDGIYYNSGGIWLEDTTDAEYGSEPATAGTQERDYSTTNNQVEGVEEADKIITDGYHIYIASGSTFFIINADTLDIEFTYTIENGYLDGLYVYDGRVVLISYEYTYSESDECLYYYYGIRYDDEADYESAESTEGSSADDETTTDYVPGDETTTEDTEYDITTDDVETTEYCVRWTYTYGTHIRVFDVSDLESVTVARELYFDFSYLVDTRMIDEQLYIVLDNYMISYGFTDELFVPRYMDTAVSDDLVKFRPEQIYFMPNDGESFGYLILVSMDVTDDDEEADVKTYLGSTYRIYMSLDNLYTTVYRWNYLEDEGRYEYHTFILRFEIQNGELVYKAIGKVDGSPLNQFSMDEYDGVFRIATTGYSYSTDSWEINNFLFCLDATTDDEMEEISVMTDLGKPGERIYAVRYSEEIAYVVTFIQTDPLYKIDLSDPENPVILGELYEEGVSDYLHEITDNLMIGIGRQAETNGEWTWFTGVKVALYDTSADEVVTLDTYLMEGEYSYTNVAYDHKAFLSFTPQEADFTYVAIPVYEYYDSWYASSQNLYLFKIHHDGELELVTRLTHMIEETAGWYRYYDSIERAVIIDNYIYTVSYSSIHMFDIDNDFEEVNSQELNPSYYEYWGYPETTEID